MMTDFDTPKNDAVESKNKAVTNSFDDGLAYRVLDNIDNMDSIDKDTDGLLVLHIGPSKTGTIEFSCWY